MTVVEGARAERVTRREQHRVLVEELGRTTAAAARGGSDASRDRHVARGKLLPRDRVDTLLDDGSPFLEIAPLAAHGMYDDACPGAGVVAGIGRVSGREVMIVANDATVKGGTYYPMTVKEHLRAQEIALQNRTAPADGTVEVLVSVGDQVVVDQVLARMTTDSTKDAS